MTPEQHERINSVLVDHLALKSYEQLTELCEALRAMALRDWAIRVLDDWEDMPGEWRSWSCSRRASGFVVLLADGFTTPREIDGASRDAARLAAADAVFPTLDAKARKIVGERP